MVTGSQRTCSSAPPAADEQNCTLCSLPPFKLATRKIRAFRVWESEVLDRPLVALARSGSGNSSQLAAPFVRSFGGLM